MRRNGPARVLIVEDSSVLRTEIRRSLDSHTDLEVVGSCVDPIEAGSAIRELRPDVITLDLEMPRMDGLTFLEKLMRHRPIPVVIFSSLTAASSPQALRGLALGAVAVIQKPAGREQRQGTFDKLINAVRAAAVSRPRRTGERRVRSGAERRSPVGEDHDETQAIVLGASTGGIQALESVIGALPEELPCVLIVQHLPGELVASMAARLDRISPARVSVATHHQALERGRVLVAPGDRHLAIDRRDPRSVSVTYGPKVHHQRPAIDILFRSVARCLGRHAIGALLTGMGSDGADGLLEMRSAGAHTIAEAESSCVVFGMPRAAIERGAAIETVPLAAIPEHLLRAVESMAPLQTR